MMKANLFLLTHEELVDYYEDLLIEFADTYSAESRVDEVRAEIIDRMNANN